MACDEWVNRRSSSQDRRTRREKGGRELSAAA